MFRDHNHDFSWGGLCTLPLITISRDIAGATEAATCECPYETLKPEGGLEQRASPNWPPNSCTSVRIPLEISRENLKTDKDVHTSRGGGL